MQRTIIQCLLVALPILVKGQSTSCPEGAAELGKYYKVQAKSGLNLRAAGSKTSAKICGIPFGEEVYGCAEHNHDTIEGVVGRWISVTYGNHQGFLFNGFLEELRGGPIGFFFPDHVPEFDSPYKEGIEYWGLVYDDTSRVEAWNLNRLMTGHYKFIRLKMDFLTKEIDGNTIKIYAPTNVKEAVKMVVYGFDPNTKSLGTNFFNEFMPPGGSTQFVNYDYSKKRQRAYAVFATGKPVQGKKDDYRMFTKIEDYHLRIREMYFLGGYGPVELVEEQSIVHNDINCDREGDFDTKHLYLTGDFDGDGKADFIFRQHYEGGTCKAFFLYLSSKANQGFLVKEVATWGVCGC